MTEVSHQIQMPDAHGEHLPDAEVVPTDLLTIRVPPEDHLEDHEANHFPIALSIIVDTFF